jgi:hypothetical protein
MVARCPELHRNLDGTSYRDQDIRAVTASYATAGTITMTFSFFDPVPASTPDLDDGVLRGRLVRLRGRRRTRKRAAVH